MKTMMNRVKNHWRLLVAVVALAIVVSIMTSAFCTSVVKTMNEPTKKSYGFHNRGGEICFEWGKEETPLEKWCRVNFEDR